MLTRRLLVLPALALALSGCAGSGAETPAAAPSQSPDGKAAVLAAADRTTSVGSSKFVLTSTTAIGGQDVTFAGEGAFDYVEKTGQLTFDVPGADGQSAGGGTIEQRIIGPDLFLTLPQMPGVFYELKVADVAGTSLGGSTDPTAALQALQGVEDVEQVGTETLRGVEATHYEGTYDVQAAIAAATGAAKAVLTATLGASTLDAVPFDAYLDPEGRLVKFEQELELPATSQTGGEPLRSRTVLELFDFGAEVVVTPPPADKVRDGAPLLAALRAALPKPTAAPSPPAVPSPAAPTTPAG